MCLSQVLSPLHFLSIFSFYVAVQLPPPLNLQNIPFLKESQWWHFIMCFVGPKSHVWGLGRGRTQWRASSASQKIFWLWDKGFFRGGGQKYVVSSLVRDIFSRLHCICCLAGVRAIDFVNRFFRIKSWMSDHALGSFQRPVPCWLWWMPGRLRPETTPSRPRTDTATSTPPLRFTWTSSIHQGNDKTSFYIESRVVKCLYHRLSIW